MWSSRVRGKNPTAPLPIVEKTGWVEANIQSLLCLSGYACSPELLPEQMSTALHWYQLQCGVHEESFLFCVDAVVVLEFQWRLYADGLHLHLVSMCEQGAFLENAALLEAKPWQKVADQ